MVKIFQISSEVNSGSVGRIAEQIGEAVLNEGWQSYIAYARDHQPSSSKLIKIGNKFDLINHVIYTRLTDRHGFASKHATTNLINEIKKINPDLVQLQHLHGYFINIKMLCEYLSKANIPVVWTFHDCWAFTGHCAYYDFANCQKWQKQCCNCPQIQEYPKSFIDRSFNNFNDKKQLFNSISNLTIVPVSNWLGDEIRKSFLKTKNIEVIHNGINLKIFYPRSEINWIIEKYQLKDKFIILGVANPWSDRKGLKYFIELSKILSIEKQIVLIGLTKRQISKLPNNIIGVERTESADELAEFYSISDVFLNPTLEEALGMTNIEALACGTPVITFKSGGSPETIDNDTGLVVSKGNIQELKNAIEIVQQNSKNFYTNKCISRVHNLFNKELNFVKYIDLYKKLLIKNL